MVFVVRFLFCAFNAVGSFVGTMSAACLFFYAFNAVGSFVSTMSAAWLVFYATAFRLLVLCFLSRALNAPLTPQRVGDR